MDSRTSQPDVESHVKEADEWLTASKNAYDAYDKLVRCTWFPPMRRKPANPQEAIICLQRAVEKLTKAVAFASGEYTYEDILEKGHDSFGLCVDIYIRLAETPLVRLFLDSVQGQILKQSTARFYSHDESLRRLNELRTKVRPGGARKGMSEWAYELSTLPQDVVSRLVKSQLTAVRSARIGAWILNHLPLSLYYRKGRASEEFSSAILNALERRGFLLSDGMRAFLNNDKVSSFLGSQSEERKQMAIKNLGNIVLIAAVSTAMVVLAALTFGHATFPGYPANPEEREKSLRKLETRSYQEPIGIAASILSVGKLTGCVLRQSTHVIRFYAEAFAFMNVDTSGLLRSESTTS
jgi:hypothetical protein